MVQNCSGSTACGVCTPSKMLEYKIYQKI